MISEQLEEFIYHYRDMTGNYPHTIRVGREYYEKLKNEFEEDQLMLEMKADDPYYRVKMVFMGVEIEVQE